MSTSVHRSRRQRQALSSCPILFALDCGDGSCCPALDTCVTSSAGQKLCVNGLLGTMAALTVSTAPSKTSSVASSSSTSSSSFSSHSASSLPRSSTTPQTSATSSTSSISTSSSPQTVFATATIAPSPTTVATSSQQTNPPVKHLQTAQVAGIAAGAGIGGVVLIMLLISAIMWYCRRRPTKEIGSKAFNPAMDSVSIPRPVAVAAGKRDWFSASSNPTRRDSTTRILDMNDPAAWRESYSAASPRELDGQDKMLSRQFSFIPSGRPSLSTQRGGDEGAVAGGIDATGGFVSPTSTMGFAVNPRTEGSSLITRHNHGSRMLTPVVAERDFPPDSWDIPAPLRVKRKPVPQFAELPG